MINCFETQRRAVSQKLICLPFFRARSTFVRLSPEENGIGHHFSAVREKFYFAVLISVKLAQVFNRHFENLFYMVIGQRIVNDFSVLAVFDEICLS